jgi:hypothetical protein
MVTGKRKSNIDTKPHCVTVFFRMNVSKSIYVLSASIGACIGALVSLEISDRFHMVPFVWVIGAFLGGLISYIAIDLKGFCGGVWAVLHEMVSWRPYYLYWKTLAIVTMSFTMTILYLCTLCALLISISIPVVYALVMFTPFVSFFFAVLCINDTCSDNCYTHDRYRFLLEEKSRESWEFIKKANPLAIVWYCLKLLSLVPSGLLWFTKHLPKIIYWTIVYTIAISFAVTCRFPYKVFLYTHSSRRIACMLDAGVGSVIGYYFGRATVGACAGAILGFVSYEVTHRIIMTRKATEQVA